MPNANESTSNEGHGSSQTKRKRSEDETTCPELVPYRKPRKLPKYFWCSLKRQEELEKTPGEKARVEIIEYWQSCQDGFEQLYRGGYSGDKDWIRRAIENCKWNLEFWRILFPLEREIESRDPTTFDEAITRVRKDIDSIFAKFAASGLDAEHFFEAYPQTTVEGRATLEQLEAQWMRRWIEPEEGPECKKNERNNLVGFAGEYLVFRILESLKLPGFTTANWTSSFRKYAFPDLPRFNDKKSLSDFTYEGDTEGMLKLIGLLKLKVEPPKKFLLEVKASKEIENCFNVSPKQLETWERLYEEKNPDERYVVLKVDNASVLPDARITQILENPHQYIASKRMKLTGENLRVSWEHGRTSYT